LAFAPQWYLRVDCCLSLHREKGSLQGSTMTQAVYHSCFSSTHVPLVVSPDSICLTECYPTSKCPTTTTHQIGLAPSDTMKSPKLCIPTRSSLIGPGITNGFRKGLILLTADPSTNASAVIRPRSPRYSILSLGMVRYLSVPVRPVAQWNTRKLE
jgi:hypothetical protein